MAEVVALHRKSGGGVAEAAEGFLAGTDLAASTRAVYEGTLVMLELDLAAGITLSEVTSALVGSHLAERYGEAAPATYNRNLATISSLFTWCVDNDLLPRSPVQGLRRRKAVRTVEAERQARAIPLPPWRDCGPTPGTGSGTGSIGRWPMTRGPGRGTPRPRPRTDRPDRPERSHHRQGRLSGTDLLVLHRRSPSAPPHQRPHHRPPVPGGP